MKQARDGQWNLGILRGDSGGTNKQILGAKPPIFPYISPRIPPQDSQVSLSTPGLFHTLDIYTEPYFLTIFWIFLQIFPIFRSFLIVGLYKQVFRRLSQGCRNCIFEPWRPLMSGIRDCIWLCINIQGMKQARGGQWNLGILRGDSGGTNKQILGAKPPIFPYISPRIPPQDSQVSLPKILIRSHFSAMLTIFSFSPGNQYLLCACSWDKSYGWCMRQVLCKL